MPAGRATLAHTKLSRRVGAVWGLCRNARCRSRWRGRVWLRPKLSDGGHETRRLQPRRPAAVRGSELVRHIHLSMSKLKSAPPQESRQLDVNLRYAFALYGMVLRHVAAKWVWRHKTQLQTNRSRSRIQHLKSSPIGNPLLTAWEDRFNTFNRLVQNGHKGQWDTIAA